MLFFPRDTWRTPVQEVLVMLVWGRFQPVCACVMVAATLAARCSPRRSFQLGFWELVVLAAISAATPAATAVCCDLWRPCPCLRGSATRLGCLGFAATMAATSCDWWRPCPCLRGSATPCWGAGGLGCVCLQDVRGCFAGVGKA